jgi:hypothetical protein
MWWWWSVWSLVCNTFYLWFVLGWFQLSEDLIMHEWRKQTCYQVGNGAVLKMNEKFCWNMGGLLLRGLVLVRIFELVDLFPHSLHFGERQRGVHLKFALKGGWGGQFHALTPDTHLIGGWKGKENFLLLLWNKQCYLALKVTLKLRMLTFL